MTGKYDFNFERASKFRPGMQDVLDVYIELNEANMHKTEKSNILSNFKPSTAFTADIEDCGIEAIRH